MSKRSLLVALFGLLALSACGPVAEAPPTPDRPAAPDDVNVADARVTPGDASADTSADATSPDAPLDVTDAPAADAPDDVAVDVSDDAPACGPPAYDCPAGYRCVGPSTVRCVRTAAVGEPCRDGLNPVYCAPGASCEPAADGRRCAAYGTRFGMCRNTDCSGRCDPGLGCDTTTHCTAGLAVGELCGGVDEFCNEGASCQDVNGTRRCVTDGAAGGYCHDDRSCGAGLRCSGVNSGAAVGCNRAYFHCVSGLQPGEPCDPAGDVCPAGTRCLTSRGAPTCAAAPDGAPGGRCRGEAQECDEGAACDGWRCVRRVARGAACDPTRATSVCADGDTCDAAHPADGARCVAPGTAPGADCRGSGAPCDGALQCSSFSRYRRTCFEPARAGDPCDLGAVRTLCPAPTRCVPTTVTAEGRAVAACATPAPEAEPNDRAAAPRAVLTRSALYDASLSADDPEDCHAVRVAEGGALYVEATALLEASLFRASGVEVGRWTLRTSTWDGPLAGSARLDPGAVGVLRGLAAGDYVLCVREPAGRAVRYALAIGVLPRAW
ncbi:MAG: hypothetical protein U0324_10450 [Polyangiales bacterium]